MNRATTILCACLLILPSASPAQGSLASYRRAEQFLPWNAEKLIFSGNVEPHFIDGGDRFWYQVVTPEGVRFMLVDPARSARKPAFDHAKLAAALAAASGATHDPKKLPLRHLMLTPRKTVRFALDKSAWTCDLRSYACTKLKQPAPADHELPSPDGRWIAYLDGPNLAVRSAETDEVVRLSVDGQENYDYARDDYSPDFLLKDSDTAHPLAVSAIWSPNSRRLFTYRTDQRQTRQTYVLQSVVPNGGMRTLMHAYPYPLPGDSSLATLEPMVFDVHDRKQVSVAAQPLLEPLISWRPPRGFWSKDGSKAYFIDMERGYKTGYLVEADASTGKARRLIEERSNTLVDHNVQLLSIIGNGAEILWSSERGEWNHLYLFDGRTGALKRQVTRGQWQVREIIHVDERARTVYFAAGGREPGDPHLRRLYRTGLDGGEPELLTPEEADHRVTMSSTGQYFVDVYSLINTAPVSVLRRSADGKALMTLERADVDALLGTGWKYPEPFSAKARDGETDIYGVIFRPTSFDPKVKYPVIEYIYTGPHSYSTPKHFPTQAWEVQSLFTSQSIAELGFVVVVMDGLGQNYRGKHFRDHQYRNLADAGLDDRIGAIKELAQRYPYLDTGRVGIFGYSAGGYAATRALLAHPDFYKVGVASAGNHDHRMDKLSWNERWMGHPVGPHYDAQSNITDAAKLDGKLLLTYGDLDANVPPASTLKLVHALIAADKDFDLIVFPNRGHFLDDDAYFIRRRWDYFVRHLLGVEPPDYTLERPQADEGEP